MGCGGSSNTRDTKNCVISVKPASRKETKVPPVVTLDDCGIIKDNIGKYYKFDEIIGIGSFGIVRKGTMIS